MGLIKSQKKLFANLLILQKILDFQKNFQIKIRTRAKKMKKQTIEDMGIVARTKVVVKHK